MAKTPMTGFKVYKGDKTQFINEGLNTTYANAIVYITGGTTSDSSKSCIFAQGTYFGSMADLMGAINYVKGISIGDNNYNVAAGGGYLGFSATDPSTITVTADKSGLSIGLTETFVNTVNNTATLANENKTNLGTKDDTASANGSAFARIANLASILNDLTGNEDGSIGYQITSAINDLKTEIFGELANDDAKTIAAINVELNNIIDNYNNLKSRVVTIEGDYLKGSDKTQLQNNIDAKVAQSDYNTKVAALEKADTDNLATAKEYTNSSIDTLKSNVSEDYNTLEKIENKIIGVSSDAKTYSIAKVKDDLDANVKEAYKLVDEDGTQVGEVINIYKDSSLKTVALDNQILNFTYILSDGTESTVDVDVSSFLAESEFKNGLEVNSSSGEVSVKVDSTGEFLSVSADGIKVYGVSTAISNAINDLDFTDKAESGKYVSEVSQSNGKISVVRADLPTYTLTSGANNGTVKLNDTEVSVTGLKSAAYTESTAYATAAQGALANSAVQEITTGATNGTISVDGTDVTVKGLGSAAYTASTAYATSTQGGYANTALQTVTSDNTYATVGAKSGNTGAKTQKITINVTDVASATATGNLADAYQTKTYVDSLWMWEEI